MELQVDITDPADIKRKLPDLEKAVAAKYREADRLDQAIDKLATYAGVRRQGKAKKSKKKSADDTARDPGSIERVVAALEQRGEPATVAMLTAELPEFTRKTIGWAMWQAEQNKRIQRVSKGTYAALSFKPEETAPALNGTGPILGGDPDT